MKNNCCDKPNIVHAKHKDILFQGPDQNGEWKEINLDIECVWCCNCQNVEMLD